MKLYHAPASPFVRKVMVVLLETRQIDDVEIVSAAGTAVDPGLMPLAQNPLGKIPALERPDGPALYDSRVICRYLDDRAKSALYGEGSRLWETLTLEATADGIMDAAILMVYEARLRPDDLQYQPWVDGQWSKIDRALTVLNNRWISHLSGPLTIAHIAVGCALSYLDLRLDDRNWRMGNDALAKWEKSFSLRESMLATTPDA